MKILNMALSFGDAPHLTASEMDFLKKDSKVILKQESKKEFCELIKTANYIAIDSDYLLKVAEKCLRTGALTQQIEVIDAEMAELPVCPPFNCQWVEISYTSGKSMAPSIKLNNEVITVLGMLINETSPNIYDLYMFENNRKITSSAAIHKFTLIRNVPGSSVGDTNLQMNFAVWMKAINSAALGIEEGEDVVMLPKENGKKDGKKKPHHIRRIVRIVPKNLKHKTLPIMPKGKVDFSHRWEVRGHWRRVAGMGKDRNGNYEIRGLTWVKDSVKGPENFPIVQKLRWIPGQAS